METIFAQCSGAGKSGVAVYRISGPNSIFVLEQLTKKSAKSLTPRRMYVRKILDPINGNQIDEALVVYFKADSSFIGEDTVEIYVHGSIAVMKLLNKALFSIKGLRLAEPGEFTRRAFLNGKFDLTAAEGLADLIDAETELQHKQAIRQLGGGLEKIYDNWRTQLLKIMSLIEAYIDFPDEDIPDEALLSIKNLIGSLCKEIETHLKDNNRGERLRNGIKLAIIGRPNVGKSSLMNFLFKREMAIVSSIPGTTRDVIEGHLDIGGYPIMIQDTAGIRDHSIDEIEQIGIKKAKEILQVSDIKIIMYDSSVDYSSYNWQEDPFYPFIDENSIVVFNKVDELNKLALSYSDLSMDPANKSRDDISMEDVIPRLDRGIHSAFSSLKDACYIIPISAKTGQNVDQLLEAIHKIAERIANPSENPQITRERHRMQLSNALESLSSFNMDNDLVLAAEDLRMTIRYLSNITGAITVDEILGEIFSTFCIGK